MTADGDLLEACHSQDQPPNQSMKATQHFVVIFQLMHTPIVKLPGGLSL
jgi:hypothetical protein